MRISLGLALLAAAARADAPRTDEAVAQCLATPDGACDASAPCPESSEYTRACLESRVPWRTAYARVHCCLRCCLRHWLRAYGLDANWRAFAEHGASQGANELLYSKPHRLDEMLVGFNHQGLLPFAARRLTMQQAMWTKSVAPERRTPEMRWRCVGERCGKAENDKTDALVWGFERTAPLTGGGVKRGGAGAAAFGEFSGGWAEIHFGDGCSSFREQDPFGTFRKLPLQSFGRSVLPALAKSAPGGRVALVTSSDCALPDRDDIPQARARARARALSTLTLSPRVPPHLLRLARAPQYRAFGERELLESPHLAAWFTTNPADETAATAHARLRAIPIGVHDRSEWVPDAHGSTRGILDGREAAAPDGARGRRELLMCCCMSTFPPPGREFEHPELEPPAVYRSMKPDTKRFLANLTDMLEPRAQHWHAQHTGFLAQARARARARIPLSVWRARARSASRSLALCLSLSLDTYRAARATRRRRARRSSRACTGTP